MSIAGTSVVLIGFLTNPLLKLYFEKLNSCAITIYNITFIVTATCDVSVNYIFMKNIS